MGQKPSPDQEAHFGASLIFIFLGGAIAIGALRYDFGSFQNPGAGFVPFFSGFAIALFSAFTLLRALKLGSPPLREIWAGTWWRRAFIVTVALLLYSSFLNQLGFLVSSVILLIFLFRVLEPSSWRGTIFAALVTTLGFYLVFQIWLEAQLPAGLLAF